MGRAPCCDKANVKKGPWSPEEDAKLKEYIEKHGTGGNWIALPQKVGLKRCGKSCRLRWLNYLRPNIKHGEFSDEEDRVIINLFANIGSRWSIIAAQLPGRTDNDIKNYWNTKLKKKLMGIFNNNHHQSTSQLRKPLNTASSSAINLSSSSPYHLQPSPSYNSPYENLITNSSTTTTTTTGYEPNISAFSSMNLQAPQESFLSQMQHYDHHQVKDTTTTTTSFMMFGDQASCSSSDGSQYGRDHQSTELEQANRVYENDNNFHGSGVVVEERVNNMVVSSTTDSLLDYGLEEIKQLISSTNSSTIITNNTSSINSCCSNNFLFDENKTDQERVLYYYHYY